MNQQLKEKIKKVIRKFKIKSEASTTGGVAGFNTPFAFSPNKRSIGNTRAALTNKGFTIAPHQEEDKNLALKENQPAFGTPALNIEPVQSFKDKNGLTQHNDPNLDPNLVGYKQGNLSLSEIVKKAKSLKEGISGLRYEQENPPQQPVQSTVQGTQEPVAQPQQNPQFGQIKTYDALPDFTSFDAKLKNSTEQLKTQLQKTIQDRLLGKKVVIRASKGYKQPEADYTVNVTGIEIDYYYDRYVIVVVGREENKQKVTKFFLKPGFKIKILGNSDRLKPKDNYKIAKSKALVDPSTQQSATPVNNVTSDEVDDSQPTQQKQPQGQV